MWSVWGFAPYASRSREKGAKSTEEKVTGQYLKTAIGQNVFKMRFSYIYFSEFDSFVWKSDEKCWIWNFQLFKVLG